MVDMNDVSRRMDASVTSLSNDFQVCGQAGRRLLCLIPCLSMPMAQDATESGQQCLCT